ncbi:hypothetical protein WN51_09712 [Melipona quadrifasciata]|uniref:Uncharacterized protein n=1 Tax=Melipona quadrifasciata TaxID=166423 RepID=A0A0M9A523_9HYME|nr:hypothetical protein WN51_09712 [Melipona quadrifasciata]
MNRRKKTKEKEKINQNGAYSPKANVHENEMKNLFLLYLLLVRLNTYTHTFKAHLFVKILSTRVLFLVLFRDKNINSLFCFVPFGGHDR